MKELALKYGCNPNQKPSRIYMDDDRDLPIEVLSGRPGYINFLDAFNGWQLVRELKAATGLPAATSFTPYDGELLEVVKDKVFVEDCYIAKGVGMVVTVKTASFGGLLTEMVGIDANGAITGVKVTAHADTKGLGTKAHESSYLDPNYNGKTELANADNIKGDTSVTFISGATISSNGVYQGVCAALKQFEAVGGAN